MEAQITLGGTGGAGTDALTEDREGSMKLTMQRAGQQSQ